MQTETSKSARRFFVLMRERRRLTSSIAIAFLLAISFIVFRHNSLHDPSSGGRRGGQGEPIAVAVATVTVGDIQVRIPALGAIAPLATVTIKTQISGQLQKIAFKEGQLVREGDFLAQIDPRPYEAALQQVNANLRRDEALLANAQVDLKRYQGMLAENSIAEQQLATQKALVEQYEGTVEGDQAQVNTATLNLQYTHIVSPISGRVGLRQVDQGNYVTVNDANGIVVVTQLQPITALFSIPEDNITAIMRRLHDGAMLDVEAFFRDSSTKLADGKLLTVDNEIDSTTGTFKLRALFDNKDGLLFANQFVNIRLLVNTLHDQTIMPNAAVHRGAPNGVASTFVFLVNPDNTVAVRPVVLGVVDGERVAVAKGLSPGDVVVTEGGDRLRDGARVLLPTRTDGTTPAQEGAQAQRKRGQWPQGGNGPNRRQHLDSSASPSASPDATK